MSKKPHKHASRLPFNKINVGLLRFAIAKNLERFESETACYGYIGLWDAPRLLGIKDDDLVFLLLCRFVPDPKLLGSGLFFERSTFLSALYEFTSVARPVIPDDEEGEQ